MSTPRVVPQWLQDFYNYQPTTEREKADYEAISVCFKAFDPVSLLTRENPVVHLTASGFIVNPTRTKSLMIYHNIYKSFAWTGGHNDGEDDFYNVALREAHEETGVALDDLKSITLDKTMISIEMLDVTSHIKRGKVISPHLHINFTYAFEVDDEKYNNQTGLLKIQPDENSAVEWVDLSNLAGSVSEEQMVLVYQKIVDQIKKVDQQQQQKQ